MRALAGEIADVYNERAFLSARRTDAAYLVATWERWASEIDRGEGRTDLDAPTLREAAEMLREALWLAKEKSE
jgi:hypothetical protein